MLLWRTESEFSIFYTGFLLTKEFATMFAERILCCESLVIQQTQKRQMVPQITSSYEQPLLVLEIRRLTDWLGILNFVFEIVGWQLKTLLIVLKDHFLQFDVLLLKYFMSPLISLHHVILHWLCVFQKLDYRFVTNVFPRFVSVPLLALQKASKAIAETLFNRS